MVLYRQNSGKKTRLFLTILMTIFFAGFFGLQFWVTYKIQDEASRELQKLENLTAQDLSDQKIKEEAISLALQNVQARVFESTLIRNLSAGIGVIGTLGGFIFGLIQYFDIRKKEYSQTIVEIFSKLWEEIADENPKIQARAIIGLADFLNEDNKEYHEATMYALALLGKIYNLQSLEAKDKAEEENTESEKNKSPSITVTNVYNTVYNLIPEDSYLNRDNNSVTTIAEGALRKVLEIALQSNPTTFRKTSWQGIKCFRFRADTSDLLVDKDKTEALDLNHADFRDSTLIEANFSGFNLQRGLFDAASLIGTRFQKADLTKAEMQYADLTGADLRGADLTGANLLNVKILNTDLQGAILKDAQISLYSTDWRLARNWRDAHFDDDVKEYLLQKYGSSAEKDFNILMLLWEYPSRVTGGGWTAAYHFIKQMRRKGANITVLVPWPKDYISPYVFGNEINVYPVGNPSTYRSLASSSGYESIYSSVEIYTTEGESQYYASSRFELINEFANRAVQEVYEKEIDFDVIHADDWLTFPAAQRIAKMKGKPWVAHFHSTEYERRPEPVNLGVSRIERKFSSYASKILVPGSLTKKIVTEKYGAEESKVIVLPNCLSKSEIAEAGLGTEALGEFRTQAVMFAGRLQWQKGIDTFLKIITELKKVRDEHDKENDKETKFFIYGRGEKQYVDEVESKSWIMFRGFTAWEKRSSVFEGASVCVVPSRYEPFGMIVLEAMCHGVPVIYPKHSGVAEVITSGFPVDFEEEENVIEIINTLLDDMDLWEKVVQEQLDEIEDYYKRSYSDDLKSYLHIY